MRLEYRWLHSVALLGSIVAASILAVACGGVEELDNAATATSPPRAGLSTEAPTLGIGGGITSPTPEQPPRGVLVAESASVPLGLGSYCWSPPSDSGRPALCADALGIITGIEDLPTRAGATLSVTGALATLPMIMRDVSLWIAPEAPAAEGDDFRAWEAVSPARAVTAADHTLSLPSNLEKGRYLLMVRYAAGADGGSEATYGAVLVIE